MTEAGVAVITAEMSPTAFLPVMLRTSTKQIDAVRNGGAAGQAQQGIARRAGGVAVIGPGASRHPFQVGRDMQRVAAKTDLGAQRMARHHRQAIVAELHVVDEAEV